MNKRTVIKWLLWLSAGLILWFYVFEPEESRVAPGGALSTHAGVGIMLGTVVALWFTMYLVKEMTGRAGPKIPALGKRAHPWLHKALYWGLPIMVFSGATAGLLAPFAILTFDILPINFSSGSRALHDLAEELHEIVFNALIILVVIHTVFHVWRHFWLKDNALRVMVPRVLHKYL